MSHSTYKSVKFSVSVVKSVRDDRARNAAFFKRIQTVAELLALWPLNATAIKRRVYVHSYIWWFSVINCALLVVPIAVATFQVRNDISKFSVAWAELTAVADCLAGYFTSKTQKYRLKALLSAVIPTINHEDPLKSRIIDRNSKDFRRLLCLLCGSYLVLIIFYIVNLISKSFQDFVITTWYPIPTTEQPLNAIIHIHQIYSLCISISLVITDAMCCMMMNCAVTQLDFLAVDYREAYTYAQLMDCVRKHQRVLEYVQQFNNASQMIIKKTVFCYISYFITAGIFLTETNLFLAMNKSSIMVVIVAVLRLYVYAINAQKIADKHKLICSTIYNTDWYRKPRNVIKATVIIMQRCQRPIDVSCSKFLPSLNMQFFSHYVYVAFSYLMAFHAIEKKLITQDI